MKDVHFDFFLAVDRDATLLLLTDRGEHGTHVVGSKLACDKWTSDIDNRDGTSIAYRLTLEEPSRDDIKTCRRAAHRCMARGFVEHEQKLDPLGTVFQEASENCLYECGTPHELCDAKRGGYCCSRRRGHDGEHAACGMLAHPIMTWRRA